MRFNVGDSDHDVFRLDIGVYEIALIMKILEAEKQLFRNQFDERNRDASLVVAFDKSEKIFTKRFKHDTNVDIFWRAMLERI